MPLLLVSELNGSLCDLKLGMYSHSNDQKFFLCAKSWTPLMVARSWHKNWLEGILSKQPEGRTRVLPSPYLALPLMSIVRIAR